MSAVDVAEWLYLLLAAYGLNLVVGHAGQPVLGQSAFVAVGAYATALLMPHWPLGLAVAAAVTGAGLLGWLVGYAAARLEGASLALATWGLAWLAAAVLAGAPGVFGGSQGLVRTTPATLVSPALGTTWRITPRWHVGIALLLCVAAGSLTWWLRSSPLGRDLALLRTSPALSVSLGGRPALLRRGLLAASAALAAVAGAGTTLLLGVVAPSEVSPLLSVQLYVAVLIGGAASVLGPVLGVAVLVALPTTQRAAGVVTALVFIAALALRGRLPRRAMRLAPPPGSAVERVATVGELRARGISVEFGGLRALDRVDLDVAGGEVHALIGPNGSGKTTLLRVLAGALPASGTVQLDQADLTGLDSSARVAAGVVRTTQRTLLALGLPVGVQVAAGARARSAYGALRTAVGTRQARLADDGARATAARIVAATGLDLAADPERLTAGEQRLLQVARAEATGASVLLLDEPAAGMSLAERDRLAATLRRLAGQGCAVLLVEHDMRLVGAVAGRVTVLAEGRVIASGTPQEIRRDPVVRVAYLGSAA